MAVDYTYAEGNITAATVTDIVTLRVEGFGHCAFQLVANGSWSGTITFECTVNGDDWVAYGVGTAAAQGTIVTTATTSGVWLGLCGGLRGVRANCSSFSAGAIQASVSASN